MSTALVAALTVALVAVGVVLGLAIARIDAHLNRDTTPADPWFDEVVDAVEHYLKAYEAWRDAPKSDRERLEAAMDAAKVSVVDRFFEKEDAR